MIAGCGILIGLFDCEIKRTHCKDRVSLRACNRSGNAGQGLFASVYRREIKGTSLLLMCSGPDISCLMRQLFFSITVLLRAGLGRVLDNRRNRASTPDRGKRSRLPRNVRTSCGSYPSSFSKRYRLFFFWV